MPQLQPISKLGSDIYRSESPAFGRKAVMALLILSVLSYLSCSVPIMAADAQSETWASTLRAGTEAMDANKYWIAEPTLKDALIQAGNFGMSDMRLAKSLGEVGRLYTIRGRFMDAEPYLEEELHVKQVACGEDRGQTVTSIGSLIRFYLNYGSASKADPLTEEMLTIVEGRLDEARSQAETKFHKGVALEAWAGVAAPRSLDELIDWAITCDAVGNDYRLNGKPDMADKLYKASLDLKETVYGKNHMSLASSYENIGGLCLEKGSTKEAETYLKDALAMTEATLPPESNDVYNRLDKLAKCYIKAGKPKQAEELYIRAQSFWKQEPCKSGREARALYALGSLYIEEKRYDAAASVLRQALHLAEEFDGPLSAGLVPYLQKYAYALYHLGRKSEWEQLNARASTISGVM